jgi:trimethylamine-N-oxide reductase (cytochrome c)
MGSGRREGVGPSTSAPINPKQTIPKNLIHDAILHPPISWYGNGRFIGPLEDQFRKYTYPDEGCSEVHMIWTDSPCWITCWNDSNTYIKALRSPKIEFILAHIPGGKRLSLADMILCQHNLRRGYDDGHGKRAIPHVLYEIIGIEVRATMK